MANNANVNKVVYGTTVLVDLTQDTVDAQHLVSGYTAHSSSGASITGSLTLPVISQDSTTKVLSIS